MFIENTFGLSLWLKETIFDGFMEIVSESNFTANKVWVDQGEEFYNKPRKKWWDDNDILMSLTYNKGKSVIVERFGRTLKGKICKKTS